MAQVIIFFSLVSSLVTNAFPNDPIMSALLPALLAVPVILTVLFEMSLLKYLRRFTEPDGEGKVGPAGQWILAFRRHVVRITDRLVGARGSSSAQVLPTHDPVLSSVRTRALCLPQLLARAKISRLTTVGLALSADAHDHRVLPCPAPCRSR